MSLTSHSAVEAAATRVDELEAEVAQLRAFVPQLRRQLKAEAADGPLSADELRRRRTLLEARVARANESIDAARRRANSANARFDRWKQWASARRAEPGPIEPVQARLDQESRGRAEDIAVAEAAIAELVPERLAAAGELEQLLVNAEQATQIEPGTPVSADPRLAAAKAARDWAVARLREAKHDLAALQAADATAEGGS